MIAVLCSAENPHAWCAVDTREMSRGMLQAYLGSYLLRLQSLS